MQTNEGNYQNNKFDGTQESGYRIVGKVLNRGKRIKVK